MKRKTKEIGSIEKLFFYMNFYYVILRVIVRQKIRKNKPIRTRNFVESHYSSNKGYDKYLQSKFWTNAKDLKDFCEYWIVKQAFNNENDVPIICIFDKKLYKISKYQVQEWQHRNQVIKKFISNSDEIVEIGCGYGRQLFSLRADNVLNNLKGYDLSKIGIETARKINDHFCCNVEFDLIDLTKNYENELLCGKTVYSVYALEQMKHYMEKVILNLIESKPKQVLHFEVSVESLNWNLKGLATRLYLTSKDYQTNLLKILRKYEKKGLLKITHIERLGYSLNPHNECSLIRWVPK